MAALRWDKRILGVYDVVMDKCGMCIIGYYSADFYVKQDGIMPLLSWLNRLLKGYAITLVS